MRIWLSIALLCAGLAVGLWDVYATAKNQPSDTVSATLYDWATRWPILPFLLGVIVGHLFFPHFPHVAPDVPVLFEGLPPPKK
jgi:hypothetical protein